MLVQYGSKQTMMMCSVQSKKTFMEGYSPYYQSLYVSQGPVYSLFLQPKEVTTAAVRYLPPPSQSTPSNQLMNVVNRLSCIVDGSQTWMGM